MSAAVELSGKDQVSPGDYEAYTAALAGHLAREHEQLLDVITGFMELAKEVEDMAPFVSSWKPFTFPIGDGLIETIALSISVQRFQTDYRIAYRCRRTAGSAASPADKQTAAMGTFVVPPAASLDNVPVLSRSSSRAPSKPGSGDDIGRSRERNQQQQVPQDASRRGAPPPLSAAGAGGAVAAGAAGAAGVALVGAGNEAVGTDGEIVNAESEIHEGLPTRAREIEDKGYCEDYWECCPVA